MWNMNKITKYIYIIAVCLLLTMHNANAEKLSYDSILKNAVSNSFELKMSAVDIDISKANLKASQADLYPVLSMQVNSEYNKDLSGATSLTTVGSTVISPYTQFKDLSYFSLQYNLFDFGATGKRVQIAKKEVEQKKIAYDIQLKQLKLKILDCYTKLLTYNNEIKAKQEVLKIYQDLFLTREQLFESGSSNKLLVMDEAVKIARTQDDIEASKLELKKALNDLSSYTGQKYDPAKLDVISYDDNNFVNVGDFKSKLSGNVSEDALAQFNPEKTSESKFYDLEIAKKKSEISLYNRQRFPSFKLYSNYSLYGQNHDNFINAIDNVGQTGVAVGITGSYVFFDGFKNKASRDKASFELKRLQLEKEKKLIDIKNDYEKSYISYTSYTSELKFKKDLLGKVKDKLVALERMSDNGMIQKSELLTLKADFLNEEFELQKNIINILSGLKEMQITAGEDT